MTAWLLPKEPGPEKPARPSKPDPVVKFDGRGEPVRLSEMGWNREERRRWLRTEGKRPHA